MLTESIDFRGDEVRVSDRSGLGVELDLDYLDYIEGHLHPDWRV